MMDKETFLKLLDTIPAEIIAEHIKAGIVTLDDCKQTGRFDHKKQAAVRDLLSEWESAIQAEAIAWKRALEVYSVNAFEDYLQAYPNGSHADEAGKKIAILRADQEQRKIRILEDIKNNESEYSSYRIGELITKGDLTENDLVNAGIITKKALQFLLNPPTFITSLNGWSDLPPLQSERTDIYFFGIPSSGKSCLLSGVLYFADKKGMLRLEVGSRLGYQYANDLMRGVDIGYVPDSTPTEGVNYIEAIIRDEDGNPHPVNIIEMSGEFFTNTYYASHLNGEKTIGASTYLSNNNRKVICLIIDYKNAITEMNNYSMATQSQQLATVLTLMEKDGTLAKTDALFIILTKSDLLPKGAGDLDAADKFINDKYLGLRRSVKEYSQQYGFETHIHTFSLGRFMLEKTYNYDSKTSEIILKDIAAVTFLDKKGRKKGGGKFPFFKK